MLLNQSLQCELQQTFNLLIELQPQTSFFWHKLLPLKALALALISDEQLKVRGEIFNALLLNELFVGGFHELSQKTSGMIKQFS